MLSLWGVLGSLGELWAGLLATAFGTAAWLLPVLGLYLGFVLLTEEDKVKIRSRSLIAALLSVVLTALFHTGASAEEALVMAKLGEAGGYVGYGLTSPLLALLGKAGTAIIYSGLALILMLLTLNISLRSLMFGKRETKLEKAQESERDNKIPANFVSKNIAKLNTGSMLSKSKQPLQRLKQSLQNKPLADQAAEPIKKTKDAWQLPALSLLNDISFQVEVDEKQIKQQAEVISQTLADFGIAVEMRSVNVGPTVVQYTLKPATGIKLAKIVALQNDLALALAAQSIRIEAPIPGQALVGIEIPNKRRAEVALRGVLESQEFKSTKGNLPIAIGRDVSGKPVIGSLAKMPHLLIAGATGSGKSVCINAILLSLICNHSPKELRLIMVDPKRVELNIYNHVPHLLTPVVMNVKRTISALRWAVAEMGRRLHRFS